MKLNTLIVNGCSHAFGDGAQCDDEVFDKFFPDVDKAIETLRNDADEFFVQYTEPYMDYSKNEWDSTQKPFKCWTSVLNDAVDYDVVNWGQNGSDIEIDLENAKKNLKYKTFYGNTLYLLMIGHIHRAGEEVYLQTLGKHKKLAEDQGWKFAVVPLDYEEFDHYNMFRHTLFDSIMKDHNILSHTDYKDYWQVIANKPNYPIVEYYFNLLQCEMLKDKLIAPCRHANQKGQKIFAEKLKGFIDDKQF